MKEVVVSAGALVPALTTRDDVESVAVLRLHHG
jgi:hypothetical protein